MQAVISRRAPRPRRERYGVLLLACGLIAPAALIAIVLLLGSDALPSIRHFGLGFLAGRTWDPVRGTFGALPFIYGTLVSSAVALVLALPVGIAVSIFLAEPGLARLKAPIGAGVELLAAIPSVVYGIWALFVMAPFVLDHVSGPLAQRAGAFPLFAGPASPASLLAAALVLAIMILPTLSSVSRDVIRAVPREMREASYALGTTWWETTWRVVLPAARAGIFGAVILAFGRAVGETIAVTMVIGNSPAISASLVRPGYTLAAVIANEFTEATDPLHTSSLIELGLILILLTLALNLVALLLIRSVGRR